MFSLLSLYCKIACDIMVGPKVPDEIIRERQKRFENTTKSSNKDKEQEEGKIKQFFDPTKSINDELKGQIINNIKTVNDRFEN